MKYSIEEDVVHTLRSVVGQDNVSQSRAVREQHGRDESYHKCWAPAAVVWPQTTEHVSRVVKVCSDNNIPMTPFGTGTGLEGGVNALEVGVLCLPLC